MDESHTSTPPISAGTIQAVLFDFGGVLATEGFREGLRAIAQMNGLDAPQVLRAGQVLVYETGYVTGHGSEADFWRAMRGYFSFGQSDAQLTQEILARFALRPRMLAAVHALRHLGLKCGVLSDQTDWLERLDARDNFFKEFDKIYISCRLGKGKNDPTLFEDVAADLMLESDRIAFLDDTLGNVERARSRGWRGVHCATSGDCLAALAALLPGMPEQVIP
jgi:putative hydrolase of the HAD superfamily